MEDPNGEPGERALISVWHRRMDECPCCFHRGTLSEVIRGELTWGQSESCVWSYHMLRCPSCGFGFVTPKPCEEALRAMYTSNYPAYAVPARGRLSSPVRRVKMIVAQLGAAVHVKRWPCTNFPVRLALLAAEVLGARTVPLTTSIPLSLPRNASILDFGCGAGWWLGVMQDVGHQNLFGYDLEHTGLDELRRRKIEVFTGAISSLPSSAFDCIRLEHVLEHLVDPLDALRKLRGCLRPRGRIVLTVPDFGSWSARTAGPKWGALAAPQHLNQFTEVALKRLANNASYSIGRCQRLPMWEEGGMACKEDVGIEQGGPPRFIRQMMRLHSSFARHGYYAWARASNCGDYLGLELSPFQS